MLDEQKHALSLSVVERIIRAVAVTPLPQAHAPILGVVNVQGRVIPVASMRSLCGLPEREIGINDQFIIANTARCTMALVVDSVIGVISRGEYDVIAANQVLPGLDVVEGVVKGADGITLLHGTDQLLGHETEALLELVLKEDGTTVE